MFILQGYLLKYFNILKSQLNFIFNLLILKCKLIGKWY